MSEIIMLECNECGHRNNILSYIDDKIISNCEKCKNKLLWERIIGDKVYNHSYNVENCKFMGYGM